MGVVVDRHDGAPPVEGERVTVTDADCGSGQDEAGPVIAQVTDADGCTI